MLGQKMVKVHQQSSNFAATVKRFICSLIIHVSYPVLHDAVHGFLPVNIDVLPKCT